MTMEELNSGKRAKEIGLDPLMEKTFSELLKTLPKRIITVITKLLSMKGIGFVTATYLLMKGLLPAWAWLATTIVLIFGEKALSYIKDIRG